MPLKKVSDPLMYYYLYCFTFASCKAKEFEFVGGPQEEVLEADSRAASLLQRTSTKDGSYDNIIHNDNWITVELPITVVVKWPRDNVDSEDDFQPLDNFEALDR